MAKSGKRSEPENIADRTGAFACEGRSDTECRILAAAFALFREHGIHATTTRKIAEVAGVNEVTLFRHFGSKDGLIQAIVETQQGPTKKMVAQIREWHGDVEEELRTLAGFMWKMLDERREWMQVVVRNVHIYQQLARIIDRFRRPMYDAIVAYFERRMKEGVIRRIDPSLAATMFIGPLMSMSLALNDSEARLIPDEIDAEEVYRFHVESYLHYMLIRPKDKNSPEDDACEYH